MARRGRGEGSVFLRPDGLWAGVVSLGLNAEGKRIRRTVYGSTKSEALAKLAAVRKEVEGGVVVPAKITLSEYLGRWLEDAVKVRARRSTVAAYADMVRLYVTPKIGHVPLADITPIRLQRYFGDLEKEGRSARCRAMVFRVLRAAFNQAGPRGWRLLPSAPTQGVVPPRYVRTQRPVWSPEQIGVFLKAAKDHRLESLFVAAVTTAFREGELLGLKWSDVGEGIVRVERQLVEFRERDETGKARTVQYLCEPKTARGKRTVSLPEMLSVALRRRRVEALKEGLAGSELVWPSSTGTFLLKTNVFKAFRSIRIKAGLPKISFHDLRHSAATALLAGGFSMKALQEHLGHSAFAVTADTYSHVLPEERSRAGAIVDSVLGGKP